MVSLHGQACAGWIGWGRVALLVCVWFPFSDIGRVQAFLANTCRSSICSNNRQVTTLWQSSLSSSWMPGGILTTGLSLANDSDEENWIKELELKSLGLMSTLLQDKIDDICGKEARGCQLSRMDQQDIAPTAIAEGKFVDLSCTSRGERRLDELFYHTSVTAADDTTILGAIACLHSLLVLGMNYGLSEGPEQSERRMSHLAEPGDDDQAKRDWIDWDASSTRRLKLRNERSAGIQLLACLKRKQSPQGAFDLLVSLGVWSKHEDLALLRSGFPLRFTEAEIKAAQETHSHDPDSILGIRQDLRNMKVFTIDGPSTSEIDDGVACEIYQGEDGSEKTRFWIHIADADHSAPRESIRFLGARNRATSHYLPQVSLPMFPPDLSDEMSLSARKDSFALSLGVELEDDGSIIDSSIIVLPSYVHIDYRLSYDDVDDMLREGIAYREEWELGALFSAATRRREFRIRNGSSEAFIPKQIPQFAISVFEDKNEPDGIGLAIRIDISHNGGLNQSAVVNETPGQESDSLYEGPVSSASVLVTEMMILAGEAIGKWKLRLDKEDETHGLGSFANENPLRVAFRSQPKPDFRSRSREKRIMEDLLRNNIGDGYCHSWYSRRFLSPVIVDEIPRPHSGLGLECYCQWTSPIRRFGDLQVHCAIKRFLRRKKVIDMHERGEELPSGITALDLGLSSSPTHEGPVEALASSEVLDQDIVYSERAAWLRAARPLQRMSQRYWMLEYIRRIKEKEPKKSFEVLVLGCVDPSRRQYAIYVFELGLEWRYVNPVSSLQAGMRFRVQVGSVLPRNGQLSFVRIEL